MSASAQPGMNLGDWKKRSAMRRRKRPSTADSWRLGGPRARLRARITPRTRSAWPASPPVLESPDTLWID